MDEDTRKTLAGPEPWETSTMTNPLNTERGSTNDCVMAGPMRQKKFETDVVRVVYRKGDVVHPSVWGNFSDHLPVYLIIRMEDKLNAT